MVLPSDMPRKESATDRARTCRALDISRVPRASLIRDSSKQAANPGYCAVTAGNAACWSEEQLFLMSLRQKPAG